MSALGCPVTAVGTGVRGFLSLSSITLVDNKNQYSYTRNRFLFRQAVQLNCVDFHERSYRGRIIFCVLSREVFSRLPRAKCLSSNLFSLHLARGNWGIGSRQPFGFQHSSVDLLRERKNLTATCQRDIPTAPVVGEDTSERALTREVSATYTQKIYC